MSERQRESREGEGREIDEIPVFLVSLAVVFSVLKIHNKHSLLARLLLTAESQTTNTFGVCIIKALRDALQCLHAAMLLCQPAPDLLFPFCQLSLLGLKIKLLLLGLALWFFFLRFCQFISFETHTYIHPNSIQILIFFFPIQNSKKNRVQVKSYQLLNIGFKIFHAFCHEIHIRFNQLMRFCVKFAAIQWVMDAP